MRVDSGETTRTNGAALLTLGGITAAFGAASCCALPILLTTVGLSAAWLGGIATVTAPFRDLLLWLRAPSLAGRALLLWRIHRAAIAGGPAPVSPPRWMGPILLLGLLSGANLL